MNKQEKTISNLDGEDKATTEKLEDLPVSEERAEEAKAGASGSGGGAGKAVFQDIHFTTKLSE